MTLSVSSPAYIPGKNDDDLESRVLPRILLRQAERLGSKPFIDVAFAGDVGGR